jgi:decaprenyl-phosphate phosphoribosyltransferase
VAAAVRPELAAVGLGYLALTASYSLWLRSIAVADIAAVAGGFVIRAIAGGVAAEVSVSRWFLTVASFGALFVVAGKRYAELSGEGSGAGTRAALRAYSERYLRFVLVFAASVATSAYCLWAFQRPHRDGFSWYELTIIPFVLWLLRYGLLLDQGAGQAPEELVLGDGFLLAMSVTWAAMFACAVYVGT